MAHHHRVMATYRTRILLIAVVLLIGGQWGVSECSAIVGACCPDQTRCTAPMTDSDDHLRDLKTQCNDRQECPSGLRVQRISISCGASDYVIIEYDCLQDGQSTTTLATTATGLTNPSGATDGSSITPSLSTSTIITPGGNTTTGRTPTPTGLSTGAKVGIAFGVIFGILLILLIVFAILVRRKNPNWPQTHNWKEPFREPKTYIPDRVNSVMNRITNRMGNLSPVRKEPQPDIVVTSATSINYQDVPSKESVRQNPTQHHLQQTNPSYQDATLQAVPSSAGGVQIVRTPQDAIDSEAGKIGGAPGIPEEDPVYEVIDDFQRGNSVYSLRRADSYDSFDSVPLDESAVEKDPSLKKNSNRMKINDAIYYGAVESNTAGTTLQTENSFYGKGLSPKSSPALPRSAKQDAKPTPQDYSESYIKITDGNVPNTDTKKPTQIKSSGPPKPARMSPKSGQKTIPNVAQKTPNTSPKPPRPKPPTQSAKPKYSTAGPKSTQSPPGGVKSKTGSQAPLTTSGEDEAGQVYENTEFNPDEDETYYNSTSTEGGQYSNLDPATTIKLGAKTPAYQTLSTAPESSSC